MKPKDVGRVVKVQDIDELILAVDKYGGFVSIEVGSLIKPMDEVFSKEALDEVPVGQHKKLLIEAIADDTNGRMGHKKYAKHYEKLIDKPDFVKKLIEKKVDPAELKNKFKDMQ